MTEQALKEISVISQQLVTKGERATAAEIDKLYQFCKNKNLSIARTAIISVYLVLKGILPDYSIGKHSATDNISKETRLRRENEDNLLKFTRRFIQFAEMQAFNRKNPMGLRKACAKALCGIFSSKPRYNTGERLSTVVTRLACCSCQPIRELACQSFSEIFRCDPQLELTLLVVANFADTETEDISVELLTCLKDIRLKNLKDLPNKPTETVSDPQLARELKKVDVIDNSAVIRRNQALVLEQLFGTVFRFLKETKVEPQFIAAMDIVRDKVKFIDIKYVQPIIDSLKQTRFSLRAAIASAHTAICVRDEADMKLDLREFYCAVYARMFEALEDSTALLELLGLFDILRNEFDKNRTAAFAKRLVTMSLHSTADVVMAILITMRQMINDEPSLTQTVDFEFTSETEYSIQGTDPDFVNGLAARYWELAEFTHSQNAAVQEIATELSQLSDSDKLREHNIRAAQQKKEWDPRKALEALNNKERIIDTRMLNLPKTNQPTEFKVFDF